MPVLRRLMLSMSLLPLMFGLALLLNALIQSTLSASSNWFDDENVVTGCMAACAVAAAILIWRGFILWTFGRKVLTGLVSLVPFAQVAYAQPFWNVGCGTDPFLEFAQGQLGIGVWIWLSVWVWWGLELGVKRMKAEQVRRMSISPTARRLLASLGALPFTIGAFLLGGQALAQFTSIGSQWGTVIALHAGAVLFVLIWMAIWRTRASRAPEKRHRALLAAVVLLCLPSLLLGAAWNAPVIGDYLAFLPLMGWGVFIAATTWYWPTCVAPAPLAEDAPRCLSCGYALKGLTHTRCPECGDEPTLEALWAGTREAAG